MNQQPLMIRDGKPAVIPNASIEEPKSAALTVLNEKSAISPFSDEAAFGGAQRMAKMLSQSTLVPDAYKNNIPNCVIAMEMAHRIGASVLMVMQNLDIVHGRSSWRSSFLIGTVNTSDKFTPLRFRFQGKEGEDNWGCRAIAKDVKTGEECVGAAITIAMAKAEGWYGKNGSKWKTMPEQMLCYRAAAFWTRLYAPELSLGMHTNDEIIDTVGFSVPEAVAPGDTLSLETELLAVPLPPPVDTPVPHDPTTGEVA